MRDESGAVQVGERDAGCVAEQLCETEWVVAREGDSRCDHGLGVVSTHEVLHSVLNVVRSIAIASLGQR